MNNLNSILIEGTLVHDAKLHHTPKGTPVCTFEIASNRYFKRHNSSELEREVSHFTVETWAKLAEAVSSGGHKNRKCRVVGRLKEERWQQDGMNLSKVYIVAEHVEFRPESKDTDASFPEQEIEFMEKEQL